ncbi:MAG: serine/threonine protein kinase [Ignavibacteriaceae bacterium]|jgi:serine/threonine protein kinase|nr:serine/threonine protein kinase [Ignavibacteriaceae bacterium]
MINSRFTIIKLLGEGRSKVFLCEDKFFPSQKQAIKILPSQRSKEEEKTFIHEYDLLKKFSHPNIIKAYESGIIIELNADDKVFGIEKGNRFFILEYFDGNSLLDIDFKSNPTMLLKVIGQLSSFLSYLHLANYIYFDLKFENILFTQSENDVTIKVVDFGLTQRADVSLQNIHRGTAYYLAPEILQNKNVDFRADLYSLGIFLYRLVYGKFPFTAVDELDIYQAHLEEEFLFSKSPYFSPTIINIITKLLEKNPLERFQSALQLFYALRLPSDNYYLDLISATHFIGRKKDLAVIAEYIENKGRNDILVLQGMQNSGKSFLAEKLARDFQNAVLVNRLPSQNPGLTLKYIVSKIIFTPFLHDEEFEKINVLSKLFSGSGDLNIETLTAVFAEICKAQKFILILDDFNLFDEVVKEVLYHIIPILQVNGCKIILLEDQAVTTSAEAIPNKTEYQLSPLLQKDIPIFLKENFAEYFPQKQLTPLIKKFADLFPGNILLFMNELITNKILIFSKEGIFVDEEKAKKFSGVSQNVVFKKRIAHLSIKEKEVLILLSSINVDLNLDQAKMVLKKFDGETEEILSSLQKKNLLRRQSQNSFIQFTSIGLKLFVYSNIVDKVGHHKKAASILSTIPRFSPKEVSRHFELAEEYDEAYLCLKAEMQRAFELSAFIYVTRIFSQLLKLPLSKKYAIEVRKEFLQVLQKTGDNEFALKILNELESVYEVQLDTEVLIKKGIFLIASGAVETGKKILIEQVGKITNEHDRIEILLEIANANLNTNLYDDTQIVLNQLLETKGLTHEQNGKVFNINGLLELYRNNNTEKAFSFFISALNEFSKANLKQRIARVQVNLGNICSMKGDYAQAKLYWKSSLFINNAIGDLDQEALLLMNYGIHLFDTAKYEKADESYKNAKNIFQTIGKKSGFGLSLLNSGETHLITCEYSIAIEEFLMAINIFRSTENEEEEASAYYLLAKTFVIIGSLEETKYCMERYQKLISDWKLGEKHLIQLNFLNTLTHYYFNYEINGDELLSLCSALLETDNKYDTILASMIFIDHCINEEKFQPAYNFLITEKFVELCSVNEIYRAVRLYLLGTLATQYRFDEKPFIDYLTEAYEIIKEQSITEFTRLILSALGKVYFERNLFSKAEEFFNLTEGLIVFFSQNISDDSLRKAYLAKKERREDLQFIKNSLPLIL